MRKFVLALAAMAVMGFTPGVITAVAHATASEGVQKPKPPPKPKAPKRAPQPKAPSKPKPPKPHGKVKPPPKPPWVK